MGKCSSRLPGLSNEHIDIFTKKRVARRDLGNRASPVGRAHMKRPFVTNLSETTNFTPTTLGTLSLHTYFTVKQTLISLV